MFRCFDPYYWDWSRRFFFFLFSESKIIGSWLYKLKWLQIEYLWENIFYCLQLHSCWSIVDEDQIWVILVVQTYVNWICALFDSLLVDQCH